MFSSKIHRIHIPGISLIALIALTGCQALSFLQTNDSPTPEVAVVSEASSVSSSEAIRMQFRAHDGRMQLNDFEFDYPKDWKYEVKFNGQGMAYISFTNPDKQEMAMVECPIRSTTFEAWNISSQKKDFSRLDRSFSGQLWTGIPTKDQNGRMLVERHMLLLIMHEGLFENWQIVPPHSCWVLSNPLPDEFDAQKQVFQTMFESLRAM